MVGMISTGPVSYACLSAAAVGCLVVSSAVTMSAPFFLGRVIDTIYMNAAPDFSSALTSLCAVLSGVFLCGAAANSARVYLMQSSGESDTGKTGAGVGMGQIQLQGRCRYGTGTTREQA